MTIQTKGKTNLTALVSVALLLGASNTAMADHDPGRDSGRARYDYAKVISAQPIVRYVTVTIPERVCWEEMQYYTVDRRARRTGGGALLGALIGGVVGHQFGSGHGNDAATVAGAVIGAAVGTSVSYVRYGDRYAVEHRARPVERCKTNYRKHQEERIDGYTVTYRYNGQKYVTQMPYDPGKKIRVRVDVRPAG